MDETVDFPVAMEPVRPISSIVAVWSLGDWEVFEGICVGDAVWVPRLLSHVCAVVGLRCQGRCDILNAPYCVVGIEGRDDDVA